MGTLTYAVYANLFSKRRNFSHVLWLSDGQFGKPNTPVNEWNRNHEKCFAGKKWKKIALPWCWPPNDTKLFIRGMGQRWATARLLKSFLKWNSFPNDSMSRLHTKTATPAKNQSHCIRPAVRDHLKSVDKLLRLVCSDEQNIHFHSLQRDYRRF